MRPGMGTRDDTFPFKGVTIFHTWNEVCCLPKKTTGTGNGMEPVTPLSCRGPTLSPAPSPNNIKSRKNDRSLSQNMTVHSLNCILILGILFLGVIGQSDLYLRTLACPFKQTGSGSSTVIHKTKYAILYSWDIQLNLDW